MELVALSRVQEASGLRALEVAASESPSLSSKLLHLRALAGFRDPAEVGLRAAILYFGETATKAIAVSCLVDAAIVCKSNPYSRVLGEIREMGYEVYREVFADTDLSSGGCGVAACAASLFPLPAMPLVLSCEASGILRLAASDVLESIPKRASEIWAWWRDAGLGDFALQFAGTIIPYPKTSELVEPVIKKGREIYLSLLSKE